MATKTKRRSPPANPKGGPRTDGRLQRALDDAARREIASVLAETGGNVSETARVLGISRRGLWKRMATLGIKPGPHRD